MTRCALIKCFAAILVLIVAAVPVPVRASDQVGVYAAIEKVVLEPNGAAPTAVQVWGAFSFAVPKSSNGTQPRPAGSFEDPTIVSGVYGPVQKGYLYFTCEPGKERTCQAEWADLKAVAGTDAIVGFGARYAPSNGRVRKSDERPASPDVYPLNFGVVRMGRPGTPLGQTRVVHAELTAALRAALQAR